MKSKITFVLNEFLFLSIFILPLFVAAFAGHIIN